MDSISKNKCNMLAFAILLTFMLPSIVFSEKKLFASEESNTKTETTNNKLELTQELDHDKSLKKPLK